jgi:hypothetical protein
VTDPARRRDTSGSDIHRYPDGGDPSAADSAISDIGYPISGDVDGGGPEARDIEGYRPRATAQAEFMAEMPLFRDSGFESIEQYLAHLEDLWRQENGLAPLSQEELQRPPTLDEKGAKQVGLRMPGGDFELLVELAGA